MTPSWLNLKCPAGDDARYLREGNGDGLATRFDLEINFVEARHSYIGSLVTWDARDFKSGGITWKYIKPTYK